MTICHTYYFVTADKSGKVTEIFVDQIRCILPWTINTRHINIEPDVHSYFFQIIIKKQMVQVWDKDAVNLNTDINSVYVNVI